MKKLITSLLIIFPFFTFAQNSEYDIKSYKEEGTKAPNTHYIGEAWLNGLFHDDKELNYNITKATFKANSTLDWHKHFTPQVIIIVEGTGYYQERGKNPVILTVGDVIKCDKDIEHWHSSSKENDVTYLAIYGGDQPTVWTEVLSQEYYNDIALKLKTP
ncbi:cupin domain-containing protein [Litoribaculum gwangyangense]|uniref:Cupin domain-containing protein n=1 Tax=Litoribaculum gwangyangense TaxID=1130722 RepID=A0ABP9C4H6_9FLAO